MVRQGRISVNGQIVIQLPVLIDPHKDRVEVDGEEVKLTAPKATRRIYLLMNKPKGVYSTNVAQGEQTRAIDLLPPDLAARLYPVGRLDAQAKGILLLTNDGDLTNHLTHPRFGIPKTYRAVVDGNVPPEKLRELEQGVWLSDDKTGKGFKTGRCRIHVTSRGRMTSVLEITLREGRNSQLRRMLARLGHKVRDLTRTRLGPLTLHGLAVGQVRELTPREVKELKRGGGDGVRGGEGVRG
jgi:23S rRNA pseudouridine2605 synthase